VGDRFAGRVAEKRQPLLEPSGRPSIVAAEKRDCGAGAGKGPRRRRLAYENDSDPRSWCAAVSATVPVGWLDDKDFEIADRLRGDRIERTLEGPCRPDRHDENGYLGH
jgi:hypothetical protein